MVQSCSSCQHFFKAENACRRFPPQVSVVMVPEQHAISRQTMLQPRPVCTFPMVQPDLYCGEYSVKISLMS